MAWYYIVLIVIGFVLTIALTIKVSSAKRKKEMNKLQEKRKRLDLENEYHGICYFRTKKDIPLPIYSQWSRLVIYFEWEYSEPVNRYITKNYERIVEAFEREHLTFVYPPKMFADLEASVKYSHPDAVNPDIKSYTVEEFYKAITDNIIAIGSHNPMLFIPDFHNSARYPAEQLGDFAYSNYGYEINYVNDNQFDYVFNRQLDEILHFHIIRYCTEGAEGEDYADYESINDIAKEIQARINQLYTMGVSEYVISKIVELPKPKLSPLLITEDFRIFLPDYNNMEITMPILSKVLYFFYLRHPEGVLFKELRDHKKELSELYRTISPREDMEKMEKSINDIVDSTKNSVNEKCSRIKAAFVSQFNDNLAYNYYISGFAGNPKEIRLDRSLVQDRSGIVKKSQ